MASTNRASGEAKLLLVLAGIVLLGGGALLGMNRLSSQPGQPTILPTAPTPAPKPQIITTKEFDALFKKARQVKGADDASISVIEFADFQCPSCRHAYQTTVEEMIRTRPARIAFFHLPLPMHDRAIPAAIAAEAAGKQGKFWEMYAKLFSGPEKDPDLSDAALEKAAKETGLDVARFQKDVKDPSLVALIDKDRTVSTEKNIQNTPTFFVRNTKGKAYMAIGGQQFLQAMNDVSGFGVPDKTEEILKAPGTEGPAAPPGSGPAPGPAKPVL